MKTLYTWTACAAFVLAWGAASAYFDREREEVEAQDALTSRDWAARQVCGPNAAFEWRGDELNCFTHRGHRASRQVVAEVTP